MFLYKVVHGLCGFGITDIGLSPALNKPGLRIHGCLSCNYMPSSIVSLYFSLAIGPIKLVSKLHKNIFGLSLKSFKRCIYDYGFTAFSYGAIMLVVTLVVFMFVLLAFTNKFYYYFYYYSINIKVRPYKIVE